MHPSIVDSIKLESQSFFALSNGSVATAYELSLIDTEVDDLEAVDQAIQRALKSLSTRATLRVWLQSCALRDSDAAGSRSAAIQEIGFVANQLTLTIEIQGVKAKDLLSAFKGVKRGEEPLQSKAEELKAVFDLGSLEGAGFKARPLSREEFEKLLVSSTSGAISRTSFGVELGQSVAGVVRLVKQTPHEVTPLLIASLKDSLPLPYDIRVSVTRLPREEAERKLRTTSSQTQVGGDQVSSSRYSEAQAALEDVALHRTSLFRFELLILLERKSEADLRSDAVDAIQVLKPLGDWHFETFGAFPSFLAAQVGEKQHVTLLETEVALTSYLPVWTRGEAQTLKCAPPSGLAVHRQDQSLASIDLFNPKYDNFSACIFGKSGRGKSVLTNLLTRALLSDPSVRMIKVDVGGSHSKETRLLGGEERVLSLNTPSGLNPFQALTGSTVEEHGRFEGVCNVIAGFLGVLLLEEGESVLSKSIRGEIEREVASYAGSRPKCPSIDAFYKAATGLPRRELLRRWTSDGVFKNAFRMASEQFEGDKSPRLLYLNFSEIFQAADPDFGQGGLAAVIAQFNLELMKANGSKLVFVCDETPFFIERCFSFFKFSTANVRKFGGSFIVIAQKSSDVVVGGDTGILDNTASKFLFSVDGEREAFAKRLKLDERAMHALEELQSEKGVFSDALFADALGARVMRIILSKEEYWRVTSSQADNEKLSKLLQAVPGLSLEQAIAVLGRGAES